MNVAFPMYPLAYPAPLQWPHPHRVGIPYLLARQYLIRNALNRGDTETASFISDAILRDLRYFPKP